MRYAKMLRESCALRSLARTLSAEHNDSDSASHEFYASNPLANKTWVISSTRNRRETTLGNPHSCVALVDYQFVA